MTTQSSQPAFTPNAGQHTHVEILNQPESWQGANDAVGAGREAITAFLRQNDDRPLLFVACGSPYYLGISAASVFRALSGKPAMAMPASEVLFNTAGAVSANPPLVIAVSRSGETSELLAAGRKLKSMGCPILAITVSANTSLHAIADLTVTIPNAAEVSMAQTRSFSAMLIATLGVVDLAAHNLAVLDQLARTPSACGAYIERIEPAIHNLIQHDFRQMYVLGSGARYGLANEGALKMKEMSLTNAEPFHFMEFRHGPQSMVDEHTLVVGLVSQHAGDEEVKVLHEMRAFGSSVLAVIPKAGWSNDPHYVEIEIDHNLSEPASLPFYMPAVQLVAYHQAMHKGLDCDAPRNLKHFITLPNL